MSKKEPEKGRKVATARTKAEAMKKARAAIEVREIVNITVRSKKLRSISEAMVKNTNDSMDIEGRLPKNGVVIRYVVDPNAQEEPSRRRDEILAGVMSRRGATKSWEH